MKVTFDATIEDFIDVAMKSAKASGDFYFNVLLSALSTGVMYGLIAYFYFQGWLAAGIAFTIGLIYVGAVNYKIRERNARNYYEKTYLVKGPVPVEIEISEAGLSYKQFGTTTVNEWSIITSMEENDEAIYFESKYKSMSCVRKRAFSTEDEKNKFLQLSRSLCKSIA